MERDLDGRGFFDVGVGFRRLYGELGRDLGLVEVLLLGEAFGGEEEQEQEVGKADGRVVGRVVVKIAVGVWREVVAEVLEVAMAVVGVVEEVGEQVQ